MLGKHSATEFRQTTNGVPSSRDSRVLPQSAGAPRMMEKARENAPLIHGFDTINPKYLLFVRLIEVTTLVNNS